MRPIDICILGGTGFVGSHLCARLAAGRHRIRVLSRYREGHRHLLVLPTVQVFQADVYDDAALEPHFAGCELIINLAGSLNPGGRGDSGFRKVHVELTRAVIETAKRTGVPRYLHMSALNAGREESYYLRSKGAGEDLAHAAAGPDFHVTSFQPSVIFGPGDSLFRRFAAYLSLTPVMPLACPGARFAPVFVGDVAEAIELTIADKSTWGKRYELCGPATYTLEELVRYTAAVMGIKRRVLCLNDTLARLQARVMEWVPGKPFSMDNYRSLKVDSVCRKNGLKTLGIHPTALEAVVPGYLGPGTRQQRLQRYRRV